MDKTEFRVRPVTRYILTKYSQHSTPESRSGSLETVGEFHNAAQADAVGRAMHLAIPGATFAPSDGPLEFNGPRKFVIVARGFEVDTKAYYASTQDEADRVKADAERGHGCEFAVFSAAV